MRRADGSVTPTETASGVSSWHGYTLTVLRPATWTPESDASMGGVSARYDKLTIVGVADPARSPDGTRYVHPLAQTLETTGRRNDAQLWTMLGGYAQPRPDDIAGSYYGAPVALDVRNLGGPVLSLLPVEWLPSREQWAVPSWYMFGGNYAAGADSRTGDLLRAAAGSFYGALAVHDRVES